MDGLFSGSFHTGVNFIEKSECGAMVRFVRVTYVRRGVDESGDTPSTAAAVPDYSPPKGFSYKTFVPSPVKVAMCSGAPIYESFASTWERARVWLRLVGQLPFISLFSLYQRDAVERVFATATCLSVRLSVTAGIV